MILQDKVEILLNKTLQLLTLAALLISTPSFGDLPSARELSAEPPSRAVLLLSRALGIGEAGAEEVYRESIILHLGSIGGGKSHLEFLSGAIDRLIGLLSNEDITVRNRAESLLEALITESSKNLATQEQVRRGRIFNILKRLRGWLVEVGDNALAEHSAKRLMVLMDGYLPPSIYGEEIVFEDDEETLTEMVDVPADPGEISILLGIITRGFSDKSSEVKISSLKMAANLGSVVVEAARGQFGTQPRKKSEFVLSAVSRLIKDNNPEIRYNAVRAAGEIGGMDNASELVNLLEDREEAVRNAAVVALEKISGADFGYEPERWRGWLQEVQ
ncbi:MAG: hypothetical protein C0609_00230 [Deltaproteobacteria bacterium]|nr:MAG: hypothetical protein C0609_00230 [Deltaproteobacteria bacterium]